MVSDVERLVPSDCAYGPVCHTLARSDIRTGGRFREVSKEFAAHSRNHATSTYASRLVPGGRYSPEFAVHVAVEKYLVHMPLDRQRRSMRPLTNNQTERAMCSGARIIWAASPSADRSGRHLVLTGRNSVFEWARPLQVSRGCDLRNAGKSEGRAIAAGEVSGSEPDLRAAS